MGLIKETNHSVNKIVRSGDLSVSRLHLLIVSVKSFSQLLVNCRTDQVRGLNRKKHAARKDRVNEPTRIPYHGIVGTIVVLHFIGIVSIDQHRNKHPAALE